MKKEGLLEAIVEISRERGVDQDAIIEAIEDAIVGAAYRKYKEYKNIEAIINRNTGDIDLMHFKVVVEEVSDSENQISLADIRQLDPLAECGDEVEYEIDPNEFASIIAQTARQLIFQKINEVERESVIEKYKDKVDEIIHGQVARIERGRVVVVIGNTVEASLDRREQIPFEKLQPGDHVRALLLDIKSEGRGPQLVISRTHPKFLMKLMEVEVPEVFDGIIEVVNAAREPGKRAKIAVRTNDIDVDPVGACVGVRGSRIQAVVSELCGERIDVVEHSERLEQYIAHALAPAEIMEMELNEEGKVANIKVMQDQLSLAIGKQGQNVRLASKLTEISINIGAWEDDNPTVDPFERAEQEKAAALAAEAAALAKAETNEEATATETVEVESSEETTTAENVEVESNEETATAEVAEVETNDEAAATETAEAETNEEATATETAEVESNEDVQTEAPAEENKGSEESGSEEPTEKNESED